MMKILVACEESQRVCKAFRERGHEAYSCDIQEPSGGHPEWHIKDIAEHIINPHYYYDWDVEPILNPHWNHYLTLPREHNANFMTLGLARKYGVNFMTMNGFNHDFQGRWDMIIAFPPCTYLSSAATSRHSLKVHTPEEINRRTKKRITAMDFFMLIATADCDKIAIENPVGVMNTAYRKPDQIIEPWEFGEPYKKRTCLWLKGSPSLKPTNIVESIGGSWVYKDRSPINRSKTFEGIAQAMAEQWG